MSLEQNVITTKGMMKDVATTSVTLTGAWWVEGGGGQKQDVRFMAVVGNGGD